MHILQLAQRRASAHTRIVAAAEKLAVAAGIDKALVGNLTVQERDSDIRALKEAEGVADLLEALLGAGDKAAAEKPAVEKKAGK